MRVKAISDLQVGDTVRRIIRGVAAMEMKVTGVTDDKVICGPWEFCRLSGAEIDEDLNWGPPPKQTGSMIMLKY